ncbi:MAG: GAF domain-containing protein [Meiothermus silvanus]|nr:GAF domain-containing protein [Allomeiothermus silvanus]
MTLGTLERILSNLSRSLAPDGDPETLAQQGLLALAEALGARGAWLRLRENGLALRAAVGVEPPEEARLTPWEAEALSLGRVLAYRLPEEATGPASRRWAELGYRGLMLAPLRGEGGLLGTLALLFAETPPPGAAAALEEVLPLFGLILQRARAEAELARRQALLEALHRLDRAMLEGKRLVEVAQIGVEAARELLGARAATVSLVEGDQRRLVAAVGEAVEPLVGQSASLEEGPHAQALRSGEPVLLQEIPAEGVPRWLLALAPLGNLLVLPLKPDGTTVGFLGVYGLSDPSAGLGLARAFAAQLSLALLREQDQEALQQRAKEQEVLLRALQTLGDLENPEEVARLLVELAPELIEAEWAAVLLLEQGVLRVAAASPEVAESIGQRLPSGQGVSWVALREGTQVVADAAQDPRIYVPPGSQIRSRGSAVVTPLPGPYGEALGVLVVDRAAPAYTPQEARLVEALAQAGATALERAQHALEARLLLQGALLAAQDQGPEALAQGFARLLAQVSGGRAAVFAHPEGKRPWRLLGMSGLGDAIEPFRQARFDPENEGLARWVQAHQQVLAVEDLTRSSLPLGPIESAGSQTYTVQSMLVAPVGRFGVAYAEPGGRGKAFAPYEVALAERLCGMLAGALERHRLAAAERRVRRALERLAQVPPGDLEALVRALGESLEVRWAFLDRLLTPEKALAVAVYGGEPFEYALPGTPCADVFAGKFCEYRQGVTASFPEDRLAAEMGAEAYLGVPLRGEGERVVGILVAMHDAPLPEGEEALRREILLAYAQRAALELAQQENQARLEAIARVHHLLRPARTPQEVLQAAALAALQETRASTSLISLYREEGDHLEVVAAAGYLAEAARGRRMGRGVGLAWRVLEGGEPLYLEDASQAPEALFFSGRRDRAAYLGVPLRNAEGQVLGVLSADTAEQGGGLFPEDRHFLIALAEATGAALARLEALRQAQEEAGRFRALAELSARLEGLEGPEEILEEALEALQRISGFQVACFHQAAPEGLRLLMVAGVPPEAWLHQARREVWPASRGLRGQTLLSGQALYAPSYPDHPQALPEHVAAGLRCAAYTPVQLSGQILGVLSLLDFRQTYLDNPLPLLEFAARRLANALEKAESLQQLRQTREEALKGLGVALEYRDLETAGHTERVTRLALRLAEAVRLAGPALTHLRWGAYLHDLGKLAIPDSILKKPGKLEPEEWERMKAHTILGEEMARRLGFLPQATLEVIRHHHERWDGGGYPDGLAGEAIPLLARVFALADVYDALTSERPYKRAWSHEEALVEIRHQAGRHFDPELARIFLQQQEEPRGG